jgi:hypothetical protein
MELLNIIAFIMMVLDGDPGHMDPDVWSHMFPFMFFYGIPTMWLWIVLLFVIVGATVGIVLYALLREQQGQA